MGCGWVGFRNFDPSSVALLKSKYKWGSIQTYYSVLWFQSYVDEYYVYHYRAINFNHMGDFIFFTIRYFIFVINKFWSILIPEILRLLRAVFGCEVGNSPPTHAKRSTIFSYN